MDLFDSGRYFSTYVPLQAQRHRMLKHAACAYASKCLAQARSVNDLSLDIPCKRTHTECVDVDAADWDKESSFHFDEATSLLKETTLRDSAPGQVISKVPGSFPSPFVTDEFAAAVAILSECEMFESSLNLYILEALDALNMAALNTDSPGQAYSGAGKAVFWDLARQDYIFSCEQPSFSHTQAKGLYS